MVDPVVIVDGKGKFLEITDKVEEITGFKKEELLGKNFLRSKIVTAKSKAILMKNLAKRMMGMDVAPYEVEVLTKDGRKIPYEINAAKMEYKGKPADMVVFRDITKRKKAEEVLRVSEEKYRTLTENINVGIYRNTLGPKGKFIEANPAIVKMFAYDKEEFLKLNVSDLYQNPEDRKKLNEKMLKDGFVRNEKLRLKKKDGTSIWGSVMAVVVRDEKGKVKYYDGMIDDMTKRKETEEKLKKSYEETKRALERERKALDRERDFILKTAHYFRNPILIARGIS